MGREAVRCFDRAGAIGGLRAKIRLATLSRITSTEAHSLNETPEVLDRLKRAMATVEAEFAGDAAATRAEALLPRAGVGTEEVLRRHLGTFLELMTQRGLFLADVDLTFRRITEAAVATLEVARASIWRVDGGVTKIVCADLFERASGAHSAGLTLSARDFQPYFQALREEKTIAAHDAHTDPRTSCFSKGYLTPLGISSMLDVPIWVQGEMVGVVCHEHVGPRRTWNRDEEQFAYLMANFAALALEREARGGRG